MGYKFQVSGLVFAAALLTATGAQQPDPQRKTGELEFQLQPQQLEQGVPQAFTFLLVNNTNHDVRIPVPTVQCEDSFNGDILLRLHFTPVKLEPADGQPGCASDSENWPPILDRIQDWKIVHPGDTLKVEADRERLFYDSSKPGTYEFRAVYAPPSIEPADQKKLQESGIDFPHEKLSTDSVTFTHP